MAFTQLIPSPSSSLNPITLSLNPKSPTSPPQHFNLDFLRHRRRRPASTLRCSASSFSEKHHTNSSNSDDVLELPLFPLPLVLFPGAILPLQIFEFRYRIMMHTLLHTDLRFGVIYNDAVSGTANVGCVGEVIKHECLVDDRFFLICKGQERFRVNSVVRTKPYLVARVTWLEDRPSPSTDLDLDGLATEVETYMKDVIRLSNRLGGKPEKEVGDLRRNLFPTPFSFFVGSTFEGAPREQQALLELEDTAARLKREKETLKNTLNYLTAASAVKDANLFGFCFVAIFGIFHFALEGNALKAIELTEQLAKDILENNKDLHTEALEFAQTKLGPFGKEPKYMEKLEDFMALLAYKEPEKSPMFHLLSLEYRQQVADSLNRAILAHLNLPSYTAMERLIQQATVVRQCLSQEAGKDAPPPFSLKDFLRS
ncbi:Lon protease 2 [Glycine max]|nr:Lon protease 2 [Glycine max]